MSSAGPSDARLSIRLSGELKTTIEQAAMSLGQTVSEFTVSTMVREAQSVLEKKHETYMSNRDRDRFLTALNDLDAKPNVALKQAAKRSEQRRSGNGRG